MCGVHRRERVNHTQARVSRGLPAPSRAFVGYHACAIIVSASRQPPLFYQVHGVRLVIGGVGSPLPPASRAQSSSSSSSKLVVVVCCPSPHSLLDSFLLPHVHVTQAAPHSTTRKQGRATWLVPTEPRRTALSAPTVSMQTHRQPGLQPVMCDTPSSHPDAHGRRVVRDLRRLLCCELGGTYGPRTHSTAPASSSSFFSRPCRLSAVVSSPPPTDTPPMNTAATQATPHVMLLPDASNKTEGNNNPPSSLFLRCLAYRWARSSCP